MACYSPLAAWRGGFLKSGKREILFKRPKTEDASLFQLKLPCGQCIGCRLERSRQWAMRCMHEASLYDRNCFITLTYDDKNLPPGGSLQLRHFQLFMKRLRKSVGTKLRFFHCGEYGEKFARPHFHAVLFNYDFPDKVVFRRTDGGNTLWLSPTLQKLWPFGYSMIGSVSFESAAYVARYILKKVNGKNADEHYVNKTTGELRKPEYITMSRRPGIGTEYFKKFSLDMYPRDYAILRGMKVRPPKFYDGLYELENPESFGNIKNLRSRKSYNYDPTGLGETSGRRLRVKEEFKQAQLRSLKRNLEVTQNDNQGLLNP